MNIFIKATQGKTNLCSKFDFIIGKAEFIAAQFPSSSIDGKGVWICVSNPNFKVGESMRGSPCSKN